MPTPLQSAGGQGSGSVSFVTIAYPGDVKAGSLLIAGGSTNVADQPLGAVKDSQSNVWSRHGIGQRGTFERVAVFSAVSKGGGPCSVTLTPAAADFASLALVEADGVWDAARVDVNGFTSQSGNNSKNPTTGNLVTKGAAFLFGWLTHGGSGVVTIAPAAGWTQIYENENTANMPVNSMYRNEPSEGTFAAQWTLGAASPWVCALVAFREALRQSVRVDHADFPKPVLRT
jgi:hypothetical protein